MALLFGHGCDHVADIGSGVHGQDDMTKTFTLMGLLIAGILVAAGFIGVPGPSALQAQEDQRVEAADTAANCRLVEIALDEGYGVTRRVTRTDCSTVQ
jgi:hypothetical protein